MQLSTQKEEQFKGVSDHKKRANQETSLEQSRADFFSGNIETLQSNITTDVKTKRRGAPSTAYLKKGNEPELAFSLNLVFQKPHAELYTIVPDNGRQTSPPVILRARVTENPAGHPQNQ